MDRIINYFKHVGPKRVIGMIVGNLIVGLGCALFKWSLTGNDPFSACAMALSDTLHIGYGPFIIYYNIFWFIFEILWGRKYIGIGTIVNACGLGYFTTWAYNLISPIATVDTFWMQLIILVIAVWIISLGLSVYQTSDTGIAPYDCIPLILRDRFHLADQWGRMILDCICAVVCYFCGGILGLGTLACSFGLGPFIHFWNKNLSQKFFHHTAGINE